MSSKKSKSKSKKPNDATEAADAPTADAAPTAESQPTVDAAPEPAVNAEPEPAVDAAPTTPKASSNANRLPAVGTRLQKIGKGGLVRGECTIAEGGKVIFHGKTGDVECNTLSGAAMANIKELGLATSAVDGFAWWGLKKRERAEGEGAAPRAPRTGNLSARRAKLAERLTKTQALVTSIETEIADLDQKIAAAQAATPEGQAQAKLNEQAGALATV